MKHSVGVTELFSSARKWDVFFFLYDTSWSEKCIKFVFLLEYLSPLITSHLHLLSAEVTVMCYHSCFIKCWALQSGILACSAITLPTQATPKTLNLFFNGHMGTVTEKMSFSVLLPWKLDSTCFKTSKLIALGMVFATGLIQLCLCCAVDRQCLHPNNGWSWVLWAVDTNQTG